MKFLADILFLIIAVVITLVCAKKGFIKSVISFFKTILSFVLAYLLGGRFGAFLNEKLILKPVTEKVYNTINGVYTDATAGFNADKVVESLPSFMLNDEVKAKLADAEGTGEELVNTMTATVANPVATAISNVLGFVGVFVIAFIGLWLLSIIVTKLIERITLLKTANTLLGAVLGLLIAFTVLSVVASLIKLFFADDPIYTDSILVKFLGESALLKHIKFLDITNLLK